MVDKENLFHLENSLRNIKKNYELENFKGLKSVKSENKKLSCTKEISEILKKNNINILSTILGSVALKDIDNAANSYFDAITFLTERFYLHLKKEDKNGIIVHDSVEKEMEKNLRKKCYKYIIKEKLMMFGNEKGFFKERIYPSIFFSNDEHSEVLQISDLISTSVNSAVWKSLKEKKYVDTENLKSYNRFLEIYWPLFVRSSKNKVDGWGIKIWW